MTSVKIWNLFRVVESHSFGRKYSYLKFYTNNGAQLKYRLRFSCIGICGLPGNFYDVRHYCNGTKHENKLENSVKRIKNALVQNKDKIIDAEQKLRQKREDIIQQLKDQKQHFDEKKELYMKDFIDTKEKIKEKIEDYRENIYTIPNFLCISRIIASPYLGYVILSEQYNLALAIWLIASLTDMLDGWIARNWKNQSSKAGSFLDPLADKILVGTLFVTLTYNGLIPLALTIIIMARDLILIIAAFVIRYKSLPPPRTFSRYFEVSNATAQLEPTFVSKVNTFTQLFLVGCTLGAPVFDYVNHPAFIYLWIGTGISTVVSGLSYLTSRNTFKYLRKHK